MNVPAIRRTLERIRRESEEYITPLEAAVVRVGLQACDEYEAPCSHCSRHHGSEEPLRTIAAILRDAKIKGFEL